MKLAAAGAARPGAGRAGAAGSEDAVVVDGALGLAAIADALGGDADGSATRACRAWLDGATATGESDRIGAGLAAAEAALQRRPVSFAAIASSGDAVELAHAGGVRIYLLRRAPHPMPAPAAPRWAPSVVLPSGATLVAVTRDHGSVADMVEQGLIGRVAGRAHPLRSRLTRALGVGVVAERRRVPIAPGDRFLIVSNGIWEVIDDDRLAALLDGAADPDAACAAILGALGRTPRDHACAAAIFVPAEAPRAVEVAPRPASPPASPLLDRLGRDLSAAARAGRLEPVFGRDAELARLQLALLSRRKPNAIVVGEPGVGKTCLVEALAQLAARPGAPRELGELRVVELAASSLIGGTRLRGELEERVDRLIAEAEAAAPHLVLFLDEIHVLLGAGGGEGGVDVADALKPALARGRLRVIGATTPAELEVLAGDEALLRRFEIIRVDEPDAEAARRILSGTRPRLEEHFGVAFLDEALTAAIDLTVRHVPDRRLPDKAIDVLEHAGARRLLDGVRTPVGRREIASALAERLGLPLDAIETDVAGRLAAVRRHLAAELVGQDDAIARIVDALAAADRGTRRGPRASLLLCGPTGVGKTEAARLLADALYGPGRLVRFDLGEYAAEHQVARLVGAPPGYLGHDRPGALITAMRSRPGGVVLFDELEKAHPAVWDVLLAILDEGRITDGAGRTAHLGEAVVVMTTNLLADRLAPARGAGFARAEEATPPAIPDDAALRVLLRAHLPAELVGRTGAAIGFARPDLAARRTLVARRLAHLAAGRGSLTARALDEVATALADRIADLAISPRELTRLVDDAALARLAGVGTIDTLRPESRRVLAVLVAPHLAPGRLALIAHTAGVTALALAPAPCGGALAALGGVAEMLVLARAALATCGHVVVDRGRLRHDDDDGALHGAAIDRAAAVAARLDGQLGAFLTDDAVAALPPDERDRLVRWPDAELSLWRTT